MARKNIRLQYNAPVTLTFFFLSLASLVLGYLTNNWTTTHLFSVYRSSMTDPLFYVRLFGHVLGHGGWDHFINNMLLFLVVAPPLEERYGSRTLLSGILMTALVSGILQCVLFPTSALLGASGIVFICSQQTSPSYRLYADDCCQPWQYAHTAWQSAEPVFVWKKWHGYGFFRFADAPLFRNIVSTSRHMGDVVMLRWLQHCCNSF